jgi:hypothetical protein
MAAQAFGDLVDFYAFDTNLNGFPRGVTAANAPPTDLTGDLDGSEELKMAGLPKIHMMPKS